MEDFGTFMQSAGSYFGAVAQVSGALLGLVFVAFTFNPKALSRRERNLAQQTFADLLMVLILALVLLLPSTPPKEVALATLAIALAAAVQFAGNMARLLRKVPEARDPRTLLRRYGLSFLGHVGLLGASALFLGEGAASATMRSLLLLSPLVVLVAGSRSAWMLVVQNAEDVDE
jgi:hypothetical protein